MTGTPFLAMEAVEPPSPLRAGEPMLARLGHELRGPVCALLELVRLMGRGTDAGGLEPARLTRYLELAESGAAAALAVIDRVVEVVTLQARPPAGPGARFDAADLLATATAELAQRCAAAGVELSVPPPAGPLWLPGEAWVAGTILCELVGNALTHADAAHVVVELDPAALAVRDDGRGIPPAEHARLLEPFERGEQAGDRAGCGLGLYLVHRLAPRIGGRGIELLGAPGEGTTARVVLTPEAW